LEFVHLVFGTGNQEVDAAALNSGGASAAIPCCPGDDVKACINRKNGAVENEVVQAGIVLTGVEKDSGVGIPRPVDLLLVPPCAVLVDTLGDCLGDARLQWSIEADTENIGLIAQDDHACPSENDPSRRPGDVTKLRLAFRSKRLKGLGHIGRDLARTHQRWRVGEGHEDSFPTARDALVKAFGYVGGRGQLAGNLSGNGAVEEWDIEPFGELTSDLVAIRTIRS
jgi:hypothetical protein